MNDTPGAAQANLLGTRRLAWAEAALVFAVFFIHGAWPAPEVNETHYLTKAKNFWDDDWCRRDFFLKTADAHEVFYWTVGSLAAWLPLPAVAWCGRFLAWGCLAWTWRRLSAAVVPVPLSSVLTAAVWLALMDRCHMAGEWVVGGVEAKPFAYALAFRGLEDVVRGYWRRTWFWFGAAAAFHVVVGAWATLAALVAWTGSRGDRASLRAMAPGMAAGFVISLLGLVGAVRLTFGVDPATSGEAATIYAFQRLPHHLVPQRFAAANVFGISVPFVLRHVLVIVVWMFLAWRGPRSIQWRRVRYFVAATIGLSICGAAISFLQYWNEPLAAALLRYYWFRLGDVIVPLGVALEVANRATSPRPGVSRKSLAWLAVGMLVGGYHLSEVAFRSLDGRRVPADAKLVDPAGWRDTCEWIAGNTPADAVFLTPRLAQSFRWYAGRAEVVSHKDIPQDAVSIVAWWNRLQDVHRAGTHRFPSPWHASLTELNRQRLLHLGRVYEADYLITEAEPPLDLPRVSPREGTYAVYRLNAPAAKGAAP